MAAAEFEHTYCALASSVEHKVTFQRHFQSAKDDIHMRKLGVMFRGLQVVGLGAGAAIQHNLTSPFYPQSIIRYINNLRHPSVRNIISGFEGVVLPGEMLLVLGRPGSGCTTFLKTLANHRGDYHDVLGDVFYDSFTPEEIGKRYRGDVIYCPEDDVHFATLKVRETLEFACTMRTSSHHADNQSRSAHAAYMTQALMQILGLEHTRDTVVGDASHRGISGGEKKRVSIAEVMSARGRLICWDNSTRGLDSSTALKFIRALRVATDTTMTTTIASVYQGGEKIFNLFDKVCIIYEGKMAYFGPTKDAKRYFMDMGYEPQNRQTTPDFLVALTDPNGRRIRVGFQGAVPRTADEMAAYFKASRSGQLNRWSMDLYHNDFVNKPDLRDAYDASATSERARHAPNSESYILSISTQLRAVMRRRWQTLKGEWITQVIPMGAQVFQAVFTGTVFFRLGSNTSAYFSRTGLLYFALFSGVTLAIAEVPGLFSQRPVVLRHHKGALYYPFIESLAYTIVDIPISLLSTTIMSIVLYFLAGLQQTAEQVFIFLLFTNSVSFVIKTCYRSGAAFSTSESTAFALAGTMLLMLVLYLGYAIPKGNIVSALRWITDINPLRYAFESLIVNEFHTINGICTTLVPTGPGYETTTHEHQVCTTIGSQPGVATVPGDAYTYLAFGYSYSNLWKNFGIIWIFGFVLLGTQLLLTQYNKRTAYDTSVTHYKEGSKLLPTRQQVDEEVVKPENLPKREELASTGIKARNSRTSAYPLRRADIFSWKNILYEVPVYGGKTRKLLDDISGYVAPGKLTALMGESGAGKTMLLNVLAQRTSVGVIHGDCFVNGHPLPADFRSRTAYVQQTDIHIPQSTVREALLFSARLRQPPSIPLVEKEAYVDKCLKMCGLKAHADAIVGSLGVEHRRRTTIGVELAAKPKLLLFLDEPTSGLDSQSAWAIVMFLRELANNGQAVLCSIHQPSGELFQLFDKLLLLRKGGQTVYFGDIGKGSKMMINYFQENGAPPCAPEANPAEYALDVIGAGATVKCKTDWHQIWKGSPEAENLALKIERIHREGQSRPIVNTTPHAEFANSWMEQLVLLTHRGLTCYWRNPAYIYPKLISFVVPGLFIGFTFFGKTDSLQSYQDKLFSIFLSATICTPLALHLQVKIIENRTVYEVRERPSRMFTFSAFLVSQILTELPWNMLASSLFFVCWYWSSGFHSSRAGFSFILFCLVYPLHYTTLLQALAVISPNGIIAAALSGMMFSVTAIFAGVVQPYSQLGGWKWMYYLSPLTYVVEGMLAEAIGNQSITCGSIELVQIDPPPGMSCGDYMEPYISFAGGYLVDANATSKCAYCPFQTADAWMQFNFHASYGHRWRNLGVVVCLIGFNVLFMFVGMYVFRIRKGVGNPLADLGRWLSKRNRQL